MEPGAYALPENFQKLSDKWCIVVISRLKTTTLRTGLEYAIVFLVLIPSYACDYSVVWIQVLYFALY